MKFLTKYLAWGSCALALLIALFVALPGGKVRGFDASGFGGLPILEGGRVKPLDSLARNSLLLIHGSQEFRHEGRTVKPDEWILDVLFRPLVADQQRIFLINDTEVMGLIDAKDKKLGRDRYSFAELGPHLDEIQKQAMTAQPIAPQKRTRFQGAIVNLFDRVYLFYKLRNTLQLAGSPGLGWELQSLGTPEAAARHQDLTQLAHFRILPPAPGPAPRHGRAWAKRSARPKADCTQVWFLWPS